MNILFWWFLRESEKTRVINKDPRVRFRPRFSAKVGQKVLQTWLLANKPLSADKKCFCFLKRLFYTKKQWNKVKKKIVKSWETVKKSSFFYGFLGACLIRHRFRIESDSFPRRPKESESREHDYSGIVPALGHVLRENSQFAFVFLTTLTRTTTTSKCT
jgi:hypothetical protein